MTCRYAVAKGRETGVFSTWPECQAQVNGYKGAVFKSFQSRSDAEKFYRGGRYRGNTGYSTNATAPQFKSTRPAQANRAFCSSLKDQAPHSQGYQAQMV